MTRALDWSSILYRNLLRVYPAELRKEFGAEMTLVFEDDLREAWLNDGIAGFISAWRCAAMDLFGVGISNVCASPGILVALISSVASAFCFAAEVALARAHAPASASTGETAWAVIVLPSLTAAAVSFTAVQAGTRIDPLRLTDRDDPQSLQWERSDA